MYLYFWQLLKNLISWPARPLKLPLKRMNGDFRWLTDMQVVKGLYHWNAQLLLIFSYQNTNKLTALYIMV